MNMNKSLYSYRAARPREWYPSRGFYSRGSSAGGVVRTGTNAIFGAALLGTVAGALR